MVRELEEDAFTFDEVAGDVESVGETGRIAAIDHEVGDARNEFAFAGGPVGP